MDDPDRDSGDAPAPRLAWDVPADDWETGRGVGDDDMIPEEKMEKTLDFDDGDSKERGFGTGKTRIPSSHSEVSAWSFASASPAAFDWRTAW